MLKSKQTSSILKIKGIECTPVHCLCVRVCSRTANFQGNSEKHFKAYYLLLGLFNFLNLLKFLLIQMKDFEVGKLARLNITCAHLAVTELHLIFE